MGKPSAPPAPDYAAAATAQGTANENSAIASSYLNQTNQVTPNGTLNYSYSDPSSGQGHYASDGTYIPTVTATTTLSPAQQTLLDQNNSLATSLNGLAQKGVDSVGNATANPLTADQFQGVQYAPSSTGNYQTGVTPASYQTNVGAAPLQTGANGGRIQSNLNYNNLSALPSTADYNANMKWVSDALYNQATSRLDPQYNQAKAALDSQLANQGLAPGSEAYNTAENNFALQRNDAYTSANNAATQAGQAAQAQQYGQALTTRQQGVTEAGNQGTFANTAQAQRYNQSANNATLNNTAQGQQFNQGLANAGLTNQAASDQFTQGQQNAALNNTAQTSMFNNGLASSQFNNQATAQAIQQANYFQTQPLNLLNSLRTGNAVTNPTFGNYNGTAQIAAAPVYAAANDQANYNQTQYKNQLGVYGSLLGGLGSLGSTAISTFG